MINKIDFFTSRWEFSELESDLKNKFQMINIAIVLSSFGLFFGILSNIIRDIEGLISLEVFLFFMNFLLFFLLRTKKNSVQIVALIETGQFTFLFLFLIYVSQPEQLKHIWIFTYPIILLYFQNEKSSIYWVIFMVTMLLVAPLQPYMNVAYSEFQVTYISVVLVIISIIIYFYQKKMDEAKDLIFRQQEQLRIQIDSLTQKDRLLSVQSKQAVMGEMISMIAHQWRQPLSSVTLSISDIQVKKMLGEPVEEEIMDTTLQSISDTVVYLSDTIDDFQTYFAPNKKLSKISIVELIERAIKFTQARINGSGIFLDFQTTNKELIETYANELVQVILNIINNAIDELTEHKRQKANITIRLQDKKSFFVISIEDNGRGITEEKLESIFEPYYSTKGKNGTGLGLYMSQMIMQKQFNSQIEVSSSNHGSRFSIRVPKKLT